MSQGLHPFWINFNEEKDKDSAIHKHIDLLISWICLVYRDKVRKEMDFYNTEKLSEGTTDENNQKEF